jgi:RNA polymerase sigma factor (sigma-70 family)
MQQPAEERFQEVFRRHSQAVTAYVRRRAPAAAVEDVVAETFLVCWRRFDRVPEEPLPWLYAVARNTLANQRRSLARQAAIPWTQGEVGEPPLAGDAVLGVAFAALGERDREVLRLVAWEQLSAAAVLGCSTVACRVRFHRAKRRLAALLAEREEQPAAVSRRTSSEGATR